MPDISDLQDDARATILTRYSRLCTAHKNVQDNADRLQAHERELMAQISDCFAAARVFGFDLIAEFQRTAKIVSQQLPLRTSDRTASDLLREVSPVAAARSEPTVRDLVLSAIERAHPNPVRASTLRRELANIGHATHEKTVGMTLYRLSKEGGVRRVGGRDWYFVPESERGASPENPDDSSEPATALVAPLAL